MLDRWGCPSFVNASQERRDGGPKLLLNIQRRYSHVFRANNTCACSISSNHQEEVAIANIRVVLFPELLPVSTHALASIDGFQMLLIVKDDLPFSGEPAA